jgi:hypothetical protein
MALILFLGQMNGMVGMYRFASITWLPYASRTLFIRLIALPGAGRDFNSGHVGRYQFNVLFLYFRPFCLKYLSHFQCTYSSWIEGGTASTSTVF